MRELLFTNVMNKLGDINELVGGRGSWVVNPLMMMMMMVTMVTMVMTMMVMGMMVMMVMAMMMMPVSKSSVLRDLSLVVAPRMATMLVLSVPHLLLAYAAMRMNTD